MKQYVVIVFDKRTNFVTRVIGPVSSETAQALAHGLSASASYVAEAWGLTAP